MRFALLGDHPDGLAMARALAGSGRHELSLYHGAAAGLEHLHRWNLTAHRVGDLEEVLADPGVEAVIVAGSSADRPNQLRRSLQAERHVLCVHPADWTPDLAYEAAMIQNDTHCVLLPLLPEALHPGFIRLKGLTGREDGPLGAIQLVEMERMSSEPILVCSAEGKPALPGWDALRALGGDIAEVSAFAEKDEAEPEAPLLLAGRFERGGLFQARLMPGQPETSLRFKILGTTGHAELHFAEGWPGPARLSWRDVAGEPREETWAAWDPWTPLVEVFDAAVAKQQAKAPALTWQDAIRVQELDDAARRSVERRRANLLEYPEASEEVGFKGTMTLVGCSILWASIVLLILSTWVPWLGWIIGPVLAIFLALQLLRWIAR